jgi:hypothetical protein
MSEQNSWHSIDQLFLEVDSWAQDGENRKLTPLQKLKKMAAPPEVMNPPALSAVLDLPIEEPDVLDRWAEFSTFKAAKTFNSTEPLGTPMSLTKVTPLAIGPTHDSLLKALSEEVPPEPDPVAQRLAKLQSDNPERWGGIRIPPGPGLGLTGSTSQILRKCASRMSGNDKIFCQGLAARAEGLGL